MVNENQINEENIESKQSDVFLMLVKLKTELIEKTNELMNEMKNINNSENLNNVTKNLFESWNNYLKLTRSLGITLKLEPEREDTTTSTIWQCSIYYKLGNNLPKLIK